MFSKSQSKSVTPEPVRDVAVQPPKPAVVNGVPSIISADMHITGDLKTAGDIQVDGTIEGDIRTTTLSVGKSAVITGEIVADTVKVWGKVNGRVRGKEVCLMETAVVIGDVVHETIEIARGAQLEGVLKRQTEATFAAKETVNKPAKVNLVVGGESQGGSSASGTGTSGIAS